MELENVVIVAGARTAFGSLGGGLKNVMPTDMAITVIEEVIKRSGIPKDQIDEVIFGQVITRTDENCLVPRGALLGAGLPDTVPAHTTIRGCGSGMQSIIGGTRQIMLGDDEIIISGGVESMSMTPYLSKDTRWGARLRSVEFTDGLWEVLHDPHTGLIMGMTAENIAERHGITREDQDEFAYLSNQRALKAIADGVLKPQIVPIEVKSRRKTVVFDTDEHPKDSTMEDLAKLPTAFKKDGGTVTAGNSSGLNDGGSAVILMSEKRAKAEGIKPLAKVLSYGIAAVDPAYMGYGPVPSSRIALERAGMDVKDIDLWELNEAFAAQAIYCERELGVDRDKMNIWGGAIAYGHPVGATGNRLAVTVLEQLRQMDKTIGLATMCIGGGQGTAMIFERLS
ncbi:MAG: thiolase family protein [Actinobacteria bacterium]|nr:thiolase family protein [Actinomycetota bacterium]